MHSSMQWSLNQIKGKGALPTIFSSLDQKIFPTDTFIKHYRYSVPISDGHQEETLLRSHRSDVVISSARVLTQACQKAISIQQSTRISSYHWLTWKITETGAI